MKSLINAIKDTLILNEYAHTLKSLSKVRNFKDTQLNELITEIINDKELQFSYNKDNELIIVLKS